MNDDILVIDGKYIIDLLAERLNFKGELVTDSNIVNLFSSLNKYQIASLCTLGGITYWHNEKINSRGDLK